MPKLLIYLLFIAISPLVHGQIADSSSSSPYQKSLASSLKLYDSVNVWSQHLYNGALYYVYDAKSEDHQFFLSRDWIKGSLTYDDQYYNDILLKYDIAKDLLVMRHFEGEGHLSLQNDRVSSFEIDGHQFTRFQSGKGVNANMRTTFYDILYDGKTRVLARRSKDRLTKIENMTVVAQFFERSQYYLLKNGTLAVVRSKKSVLDLLFDKKKELKKYLRVNKIRFSENREEVIAKMAIRYDELTQP